MEIGPKRASVEEVASHSVMGGIGGQTFRIRSRAASISTQSRSPQLPARLTDRRICSSLIGKVTYDLVPVFRKRNADQGLAEITAGWWCLFDLLRHLGYLLPPLSW